MTSAFADILPGDELWVINSRFNGVFAAKVISAQDGVIVVEVKAKRINYRFDWETGRALDGDSVLAFGDDWRVKTILLRKEHLRLHQAVIEAASNFQKNPTQKRAEELMDASVAWVQFAGGSGDYHALVSHSLHTYLEKTGGAHYSRRLEELGRA